MANNNKKYRTVMKEVIEGVLRMQFQKIEERELNGKGRMTYLLDMV